MNGLKKNQQRIGEAIDMLNLPIVSTQVTLRGNVGYLKLIGRPNYSRLAVGGRYCTEIVVNGLKKSAKNRERQ